MYKVLYLTQFPEIGGGETTLLSLLASLDRQKFEPIVVVPKRGQLSQQLNRLKISTYYLKLNPYLTRTLFVPGASPTGLYRLFKLVHNIKPDIIHLNHLTLAVYAGIVAKVLRIPLVATSHGNWDTIYFFQDILSRIFVNRLFSSTKSVKQKLLERKIIRSSLVTVMPFGVDLNFFKPASKTLAKIKLGLDKDDFVITIVGRLDPIKDHLAFLHAAKIVQDKITNAKFLIVGSKQGNFSKDKFYAQQISNYLKENPSLSRKVTLTNYVTDMPKIYNATDILVSTSHSESFGLVMLEAASCLVPTIATKTQGSSSIIHDNYSGILCAKNPSIIASNILDLYQNPQKRRLLAYNARSLVKTKYDLKNYVKAIERSYLEILSDITLPK